MSLVELYKSSSKALISISSLIYRMPVDKKFYYSRENLIIDKYNLDIFKKDFINKLNLEGNFPSKDFDHIYEKVKKDPYLSDKEIDIMLDKIF
mgnify:CR=1 FL=1